MAQLVQHLDRSTEARGAVALQGLEQPELEIGEPSTQVAASGSGPREALLPLRPIYAGRFWPGTEKPKPVILSPYSMFIMTRRPSSTS